MTPQAVDTTSEVVSKLQALPQSQRQQVLDFIDFLASKYTQHQEAPQQRILGLNKGEFWISDDFNDLLPDEFWLGEGII